MRSRPADRAIDLADRHPLPRAGRPPRPDRPAPFRDRRRAGWAARWSTTSINRRRPPWPGL